MVSTSQEMIIDGDSVKGVKPMVTATLQTSSLPIGQSGDGMNQNIMNELKALSISYGAEAMMPTPGISPQEQAGMSQQEQAGMQPLGVTNSSMTSMSLSQQTSGDCKASDLFVKVWEGALCGRTQGQSSMITKLEGYRRGSGSETLAADWPPMMQMDRFISKEQMHDMESYSQAEFVAFQPLEQHEFLCEMHDKKLCAVIQLPSQILLFSVSGKAGKARCLTGLIMPREPEILFDYVCIFAAENKKRKKEPNTMFSTSQETILGGDNVQGVKPMVTTTLQTSPLTIGQSGNGMNQNIMDGLKSFITSYGTGTMMPTPGMSQQVQAGMLPLGGTNSSTTNMPLPQQTSGGCKAADLFVKVWEGALSETRQGQSGFIKLEGYRRASGSETVAADWPPVMQTVRFISKEHILKGRFTGKAEFVTFRPLKHENLGQIHDKNLCSVIVLPSQILLLSFLAKARCFTGMLVPRVFRQFAADRLPVTLGCKKKYDVDDRRSDPVMSSFQNRAVENFVFTVDEDF